MSATKTEGSEMWSDPDEDVSVDMDEEEIGDDNRERKKSSNHTDIGNILFSEDSVEEPVPIPKGRRRNKSKREVINEDSLEEPTTKSKEERASKGKRKLSATNGDKQKKSTRKRLKRHSGASFIDDDVEVEAVLNMDDSSENSQFSEHESDRGFIVDDDEEIEMEGDSQVEPHHAYAYREKFGKDEVERVPHYGSSEYEKLCKDKLKVEIMNPKNAPLPPFLGGVLEAHPDDFDEFYGKTIPEDEDAHESLKGATCVLPGLCYPRPDELTANERDKIPKQDAFPAIFRKNGKYVFAKRNRTKKATTWKSFTPLPKSLRKRVFHFCEEMPPDAPDEITVHCVVPCWGEKVVMKLPFGIISKMFKFKKGGKKGSSSTAHKKSNLGKRTNENISSGHSHSVKSTSEKSGGDIYDELDKEIERIGRKLPGNGKMATVEGLAQETRRKTKTPPPVERRKGKEENIVTAEPLRKGKRKTARKETTKSAGAKPSENKGTKRALSELLKCKCVDDVLARIPLEAVPNRIQLLIDRIREDSKTFMQSPRIKEALKKKGIDLEAMDDPYEVWSKAKSLDSMPLRPEKYTYQQLKGTPEKLIGLETMNDIAQSPQIVFQIFMAVYRFVALYHSRKEKAYNQAIAEMLETLRQTASSDGRRIKALNDEIEKLKKEASESLEKEREASKKENEVLKKKNKDLEAEVTQLKKKIAEQRRKDTIGDMQIGIDF